MEYLPHDSELKSGVSLWISSVGGGVGANVPFFGRLGVQRAPIEFQFVPKMLSDSRKGSWDEAELIGDEPISTLATTGPRIMSMSWTYIVDEIGNINSGGGLGGALNQLGFGDGVWTIARIKRNLNLLKGYFLQSKIVKNDWVTHSGLVAVLTWPLVGGKGSYTCRMTSVDIKHSENMVGNRNIMFPLRTDVSVDIRLWTNGTTAGAADAKTKAIADLKPTPSFDDLWF